MFAVVEEVVRGLFGDCELTSLTIFSTVSLSKCMTSSSLAMLKCSAFATWLIAVLRVSTLLSYLLHSIGIQSCTICWMYKPRSSRKGLCCACCACLGFLRFLGFLRSSGFLESPRDESDLLMIVQSWWYLNILLIRLIRLHLANLLGVLLNGILYHHMRNQRHTGIAWKDDEFVCRRRVWISLPMYCNWTR